MDNIIATLELTRKNVPAGKKIYLGKCGKGKLTPEGLYVGYVYKWISGYLHWVVLTKELKIQNWI